MFYQQPTCFAARLKLVSCLFILMGKLIKGNHLSCCLSLGPMLENRLSKVALEETENWVACMKKIIKKFYYLDLVFAISGTKLFTWLSETNILVSFFLIDVILFFSFFLGKLLIYLKVSFFPTWSSETALLI